MKSFVTERLKSHPAGVLTRLEKEFATLRDELAIWSADGALPHAQTSEPEGAPAAAGQRQAREQFSAKLQDIWQRKSVSKWDDGHDCFSHYVEFSGELPRLSARFAHVTELLLTANKPGARIGAFLDSFPNIEYLGVVCIKMEEFASAIFQMRRLSELTLDGCSLKLNNGLISIWKTPVWIAKWKSRPRMWFQSLTPRVSPRKADSPQVRTATEYL